VLGGKQANQKNTRCSTGSMDNGSFNDAIQFELDEEFRPKKINNNNIIYSPGDTR
jgi:hypothetical protein